jgi:hypothetical protein
MEGWIPVDILHYQIQSFFMNKGRMFKGLALLPAVLLVLILAHLLTADYNTLVSEASRMLNTNTENLIRELIPPGKLFIIELFLWFVVLAYIGLVFFAVRLFRDSGMPGFVRAIAKKTYEAWTVDKLYFLLFIPVGASLYYALTLPISYDEAFTYLNFSSRGIVSSVAYYPFPNNHILHSVFTNLSLKLPFGSDLFLIRLPSIVFFTLSIVVVFLLCKEFLGKREAYIATGIFSSFFFSLYYSYMSRGYSLLGLCFLTALYLSFKICQFEKSRYWIAFTVTCALGFYAIPTFLYPYVTINVFILAYRRRLSLGHFISGVATVVIVLILYTPIVLVNGTSAIVGNRWTRPIERSEVLTRLIPFFSDSVEKITGITIVLSVLVVIAAAWVLTRKKTFLLYFFIVMLVSPFILLLAHSVIPFSRTFAYYNIFFAMLIALVITYFVKNMKVTHAVILAIVCQLMLLVNFNRLIYKYEDFAIYSAHDSANMMDGKHFLIDESIFDSMMLYRFAVDNKKDFDFKWMNNVLLDADTIANFDYIIVHKMSDRTVNKTPSSSNPYYNVYRREIDK